MEEMSEGQRGTIPSRLDADTIWTIEDFFAYRGRFTPQALVQIKCLANTFLERYATEKINNGTFKNNPVLKELAERYILAVELINDDIMSLWKLNSDNTSNSKTFLYNQEPTKNGDKMPNTNTKEIKSEQVDLSDVDERPNQMTVQGKINYGDFEGKFVKLEENIPRKMLLANPRQITKTIKNANEEVEVNAIDYDVLELDGVAYGPDEKIFSVTARRLVQRLRTYNDEMIVTKNPVKLIFTKVGQGKQTNYIVQKAL